MKWVFWNQQQRRLRTGWRILIFIILLVVLSVSAQLSTRAMLGSLPRGSDLVIYLIAGAATIAVLLARKHIDRKTFGSLGLSVNKLAVQDLVLGFVLSAGMTGLIFLVMLMSGLVEATGIGTNSTADSSTELASNLPTKLVPLLLLSLMPNIMVGWWEELVFRGYLLQNLIEGIGLVAAVLFSCVLYGLVHAFNPSASVLSSSIIVLFGYLRIFGYTGTGCL